MPTPLPLRLATALIIVSLPVLTMGCATSPNPSPTPKAPLTGAPQPSPSAGKVEHADHDHHHAAPHGGALAELGEEEAHIEVLLDKGQGRIDLYFLDGEAEQAIRTEKEQELVLTLTSPAATIRFRPVADDLSGETLAVTSHYAGQDKALAGLAAFQGQLKEITLRGKTYRDVKLSFPVGSEED